MSRRDHLRALIDRLPDDRLDELLALARRLDPPADPPPADPPVADPPVADRPTLMDRLRQITIDAPPDFAATMRDRPSFLRTARALRVDTPPDFATNLDDYLYGGKGSDEG